VTGEPRHHDKGWRTVAAADCTLLRRQGNDRRSHGNGTPLLNVESADDRVTLDTVGVYAFARCSNDGLRASIVSTVTTSIESASVWAKRRARG
jgi:hypothetical protein